jgi:hypothetical protein
MTELRTEFERFATILRFMKAGLVTVFVPPEIFKRLIFEYSQMQRIADPGAQSTGIKIHGILQVRPQAELDDLEQIAKRVDDDRQDLVLDIAKVISRYAREDK